MNIFCNHFFCKRLFLVYFLIFPLFGCIRQAPRIVKPKAPKNIVLLICDGAGLSQISSAYFYKNSFYMKMVACLSSYALDKMISYTKRECSNRV